MPWYEVLQRPGFTLKRNSPSDDPGGYRAVFVVHLAEQHYSVPGLGQRILGGDDNPAQILTGGFAGIEAGTDDALFTYATAGFGRRLPQIALADAINLGNPDQAAFYARAAYTASDGYTFRGTPARLSITIPELAPNPGAAEAFVQYLLAPAGQAALSRYGFLPAPVLVGGDATTVPNALRTQIQGRYGT